VQQIEPTPDYLAFMVTIYIFIINIYFTWLIISANLFTVNSSKIEFLIIDLKKRHSARNTGLNILGPTSYLFRSDLIAFKV